MKEKNFEKMLTDYESGLFIPTHKELFEIIFSYSLPEDIRENISELVYKKLFCEGGIFMPVPEKLFEGEIKSEYFPLIKALISIMKLSSELNTKENILDSHRSAGEFIKNFVGSNKEEGLYTVFMGEFNNVLHAEKTANGDLGSVFIDVDSMIKRANEVCAKKVIIAHNHTTSYMNYSMEDYHATEKTGAYFSAEGIKLMEHFVVNKGRYYGILYNLADTDNWKR